ncbi:hypothetical protein O6H91_Y492700 [Diphasiastrum complanatum]|nr:hypothetical protein O6H91_Y492700 [Diphasiastrum complanatum]
MASAFQKSSSPREESSEEPEEGEISDNDHEWKEEDNVEISDQLSDLDYSSMTSLPIQNISGSKNEIISPQAPEIKKSENLQRGLLGRKEDSILVRDRIGWNDNKSWRRDSPFSAPSSNYYNLAWAQGVQGRPSFRNEGLQKDESFTEQPGGTPEHTFEDPVSEELMERRVYPQRSRSLKERLSIRSPEIDDCSEATGLRGPFGLSKNGFRVERSFLEDSKLMSRRKGRSCEGQSETSERDERLISERMREKLDLETGHSSRETSDRYVTLKSKVEKVDSDTMELEEDTGSVRLAKTDENENSNDSGSFVRSEEQAATLSHLLESPSKEKDDKRGDDLEGGELEEGEIELISSLSRPCSEQSKEMLHNASYRGIGNSFKRVTDSRLAKIIVRPQSRSRSRSKEVFRQGRVTESKHQLVIETQHERARSINWARELLKNVTVKDAQRSFIGACERLIKAVEILEDLSVNQPYYSRGESELPQVISRLARQAFDGIRAVYAVRNTATGREQERDRNIFPRLLELSIGCAQKLFTSKQARELEAMMLAISSQTNVAKPGISAKSLHGVSQIPSIFERLDEKESKVPDASENTIVREKFVMQSSSETESSDGMFIGSEATVADTKQASDAAALAAAAIAYARSSAAIYSPEGLNQSGSETYPRANTLPLSSTASTYDAWMDPAILTTGGDISQAVRSWGHGGSGISDSASVALKPSYKPWTETNSWQSEQNQEFFPSSYRGAVLQQPGFENSMLQSEVQDARHHASTRLSIEVDRSDALKPTGVSSNVVLPASQGTSALHSDPRGRSRSSTIGLDPALSYKINAAKSALFSDRLPSPTPSEEDLEARSTDHLASGVVLDRVDVGPAENPDSEAASQLPLELIPSLNMSSVSKENSDERQWMDASRLVVDLNCEGAMVPGIGPTSDGPKLASDKNQSDSFLFGLSMALKSRDPRRHLTTISTQGSNFLKDSQPPKRTCELDIPDISQILEVGSKKREASSGSLRGVDAKRPRIEPENIKSFTVEVLEEPTEMEVDSEDAALNRDKQKPNLCDSLEMDKKQITAVNQGDRNIEASKQSNSNVIEQPNDFSLSKKVYVTEAILMKEKNTTNLNTMGIDLDIKGEIVQGLKSNLKHEAGTNLVVDVSKRRMKPRDPRRVLLESHSGRQDVPNQVAFGGSNSGSQTLMGSSNSSTLPQDAHVSNLLASQAFPQENALPTIAPSFMEKLASLAEIVGTSKGNFISGKLLPVSKPVVGPAQSAENEFNKTEISAGLSEVDFLQTSTSDSLAAAPSSVFTERETSMLAVNRQEKISFPQASKQGYMDLDHLLKDFNEDERLAIQQERLRRMEEQERMLSAKKLCLVLDLDHTLLNSAKFSEIDQEWEQRLRVTEAAERNRDGNNSMRRELYRFPHMSMWTKLRPGIRKFLDRASQLYELHVYTMGNKAYATEMAKLLDPTGTLFAGRVISKGDDSDIVDGDERPPKSKDLDGVLGMESAVVIIDDSARVWPHHRDNLIVVERYMYFPCSRRQFGLLGPSLLEVGHDEREADGMLASTLMVIGTIHQNFFLNQRFREMDVRQILATEQQRVLGGCRIMFSRIFPVGEAQPHLHPLWRTAEQFGATCTTKIDNNITHVVAISLGTDKVNWALANGRFVVRPAWLEASAVLYRRANERDFSVPP